MLRPRLRERTSHYNSYLSFVPAASGYPNKVDYGVLRHLSKVSRENSTTVCAACIARRAWRASSLYAILPAPCAELACVLSASIPSTIASNSKSIGKSTAEALVSGYFWIRKACAFQLVDKHLYRRRSGIDPTGQFFDETWSAFRIHSLTWSHSKWFEIWM